MTLGSQWAVLPGTPPRVRRRPSRCRNEHARPGNTSARAEKTMLGIALLPPTAEHLRACGEDSTSTRSFRDGRGTPPRVRRRHFLTRDFS